MADKNIQLKSKTNDNLFPVTKIENVDGLETVIEEIEQKIDNVPVVDGGTF